MEEFYRKVAEYYLSPNQFYVLFCVKNGIEVYQNVNLLLEMRVLRTFNYLDKSNRVTEKGDAVLTEALSTLSTKIVKKTIVVDPDMVEQYRLKWPVGKLPSGSYARVNNKNLETAFKWFFANYKYDWETILMATDRYLDEYESKGYKFMRTSQYFIKKSESSDKSISSELANYCDHVLNKTSSQNAGTYIFPEKVD
jgi:hypothetical protein